MNFFLEIFKINYVFLRLNRVILSVLKLLYIIFCKLMIAVGVKLLDCLRYFQSVCSDVLHALVFGKKGMPDAYIAGLRLGTNNVL